MNVGGDSEFQDQIITVTVKNMMHLLENHSNSTEAQHQFNCHGYAAAGEYSDAAARFAKRDRLQSHCEAKGVSMSMSLAAVSGLCCR